MHSDGSPRIFYELRGNAEGPTLVMVRGLGRFALHWGAVLDELARDFYLVLLDNRGTGRSEPARLPFAVADLADDVARVLDHAGIGRAHVLGMSLGGMIALRFALDHGGRLDRLVLLCTTAGGRRSVAPPIAPFVRMAAAKYKPPAERVRIEAALVLGEAASHSAAAIDDWARIAESYPMSARTLVYQALAAKLHDAGGELDRVGAPTLVMSCERDHLIPPENSRVLARAIRGAELSWLPGDAHDLTTAYPARSAELIRDFLLR